ncbi:MAG TPA: ABC transporter permease [Kofleriaceae bacterium]
MVRAIKKDVGILLRDRGALISLFALPIVFMLAFGAIFGSNDGSGTTREIALWGEPGDARADRVEATLAKVPGFHPVRSPDADAVRRAVAQENVAAGLVFASKTDAPIEVVIDMAAPVQARAPLQYSLEAIVTQALSPPSTLVIEAKSPPGTAKPLANASSFQVSVPSNAVLFGFFIALTTAMAFASERRTGTWRRLLAAPVPRWKVLVATLLPYFVVGCLQLAFLFGIGAAVFGMKIAGSLAALIVLSAAQVACAVSLGLLFASFGGSERQLGGIASVVLLVMGLVGGCMVPRIAMPAFMKSIGLAVPHGWALDGYYDVLVREGTSIVTVAPSVGALLCFAVVFAGVGSALFRFER